VILTWEAMLGKHWAADADETTADWSTEKSGVSLCLSQALIEGRCHLSRSGPAQKLRWRRRRRFDLRGRPQV